MKLEEIEETIECYEESGIEYYDGMLVSDFKKFVAVAKMMKFLCWHKQHQDLHIPIEFVLKMEKLMHELEKE